MEGSLHPKHLLHEILNDLKPHHLIVGAGVLVALGFVLTRFLPGAATVMGLQAKPIAPQYQQNWYSPFGTRPWLASVVPANVNPANWTMPTGATPATPAAPPTQAMLGQSIVAATSASLSSITGGGGSN